MTAHGGTQAQQPRQQNILRTIHETGTHMGPRKADTGGGMGPTGSQEWVGREEPSALRARGEAEVPVLLPSSPDSQAASVAGRGGWHAGFLHRGSSPSCHPAWAPSLPWPSPIPGHIMNLILRGGEGGSQALFAWEAGKWGAGQRVGRALPLSWVTPASPTQAPPLSCCGTPVPGHSAVCPGSCATRTLLVPHTGGAGPGVSGRAGTRGRYVGVYICVHTFL